MTQTESSARSPSHKIHEIFTKRYSSRSFDPNTSVTNTELNSLFEAARWAPSCANSQPWRFIYARRSNETAYNRIFQHLQQGNQVWAKNAEILVVVLSYKKFTFYGNVYPSVSHSFDAGAASVQLQLQASLLDIIAHPIGGFDYAKIFEEFVGDREDREDYAVEAVLVVGKADKHAAEQEVRSQRNPISQFVFENEFTLSTKEVTEEHQV